MFWSAGTHPQAVIVMSAVVAVMLLVLHINQRMRNRSIAVWVEQSQPQSASFPDNKDAEGERKTFGMESLIEYCLSKRGASKDFPFGPEPLVAKVGGKMFALISGHSLSLKCDPVIAENLREQYESIAPGYHLSKKHWNSIRIDGSIDEDEIKEMIDHSYGLVCKGLTKAERERLNIKL